MEKSVDLNDIAVRRMFEYRPIPNIESTISQSSKNRLEGIDIESEYKLIKEKKSKLSSRLRAEVVKKYEKNKGDYHEKISKKIS